MQMERARHTHGDSVTAQRTVPTTLGSGQCFVDFINFQIAFIRRQS